MSPADEAAGSTADGPLTPADRVRLVVRDWDDGQLRRAWRTSAHAVAPSSLRDLGEAVAVRAVLLEEWERRHPRVPADWAVGELD